MMMRAFRQTRLSTRMSRRWRPFSLVFLSGFLCGMLCVLILRASMPGADGRDNHKSNSNRNTPSSHGATTTATPTSSSSFALATDLPWIKTSHGTLKQQLVTGFTVHPDLAGITMAVLQPGERVETHVHSSMHEFVYVSEGSIHISVTTANSSTTTTTTPATRVCPQGCFFHAVPGEPHSFEVPADALVAGKMVMFQLIAPSSSSSSSNTG